MTPMEIALGEARAAAARGEVPVGAVGTRRQRRGAGARGERGGSTARSDGTRRDAGAASGGHGTRRGASAGLRACRDVEPSMCAQAASFFRIRRLTFGAYDAKGGGVNHGARVFDASSCHHRPEVIGGVREREAATLLRIFFDARR